MIGVVHALYREHHSILLKQVKISISCVTSLTVLHGHGGLAKD